MLPTFAIFIAIVVLAQFSIDTLRIYIRGQSGIGKFRWIYTVATFVLAILYMLGKYVNHSYPDLFDELAAALNLLHPNLPELVRNSLAWIEYFLRFDTIVLLAILAVIIFEGIAIFRTLTVDLPAKQIYSSIPYPSDDTGALTVAKVMNEVQIAFQNICGWVIVQVRNFLRYFVYSVKLLIALVRGVWQSCLNYAEIGISVGLLFLGEMCAFIFVSLAIWILYFLAGYLLQPDAQLFLVFIGVLVVPWILLVPYIANYYRYWSLVVRHFRQSFLGFTFFFSLVYTMAGAGLWWQFGGNFKPGVTIIAIVCAFLGLWVWLATSGVNTTTSQHASNTEVQQCAPSVWIYFLVFALTVAVIWRARDVFGLLELISDLRMRMTK